MLDCAQKKYETKAQADDMAVRMMLRNKSRHKSFQCPLCGFWHVTSLKQKKRKRL